MLCTRLPHRDCVGMPDAGLHPHREARHKQHTHSQGHRAVCPSATHMSIRKRDRTKPGRNAATAAQTHWSQPTIWRGHTRSTISPKEGKIRGYISKEFCAKTDLCPLASPRVALVGVCLLRHPDKGRRHEVRQGDTHDSGSAAIRVSPCQTSNAKLAMAQ